MGMSKLYECIKTKKVNNSQAREAIYEVFLKADNCMSVAQLNNDLKQSYPRKMSLNTIYRHLTLFVECGLVMVIQDDFKKAYYCLTGEKAKAFAICPKCNYLSTIKGVEPIEKILDTLSSTEFITIHKRCESCN